MRALALALLLCSWTTVGNSQTDHAGRTLTLDAKWNQAITAVWQDQATIDQQIVTAEGRYPELARALRVFSAYAFYGVNRHIDPREWSKIGFGDPCETPAGWQAGGRCREQIIDAKFLDGLRMGNNFVIPRATCSSLNARTSELIARIAASADAGEVSSLKAELEAAERAKISLGCVGNACGLLQQELDSINQQLLDPAIATTAKLDMVARKIEILEDNMPYWDCTAV